MGKSRRRYRPTRSLAQRFPDVRRWLDDVNRPHVGRLLEVCHTSEEIDRALGTNGAAYHWLRRGCKPNRVTDKKAQKYLLGVEDLDPQYELGGGGVDLRVDAVSVSDGPSDRRVLERGKRVLVVRCSDRELEALRSLAGALDMPFEVVV